MARQYEDNYRQSVDDPEAFWGEQAEKLHWFKRWDRVLDETQAPFTRWFAGGETNLCYNAVDRHVEAGRADKQAIVWVSPEEGKTRTISFGELHQQVSTLAAVLQGMAVNRGDRVLIYMPMVPEALIAVLACARIGAIHSVVFGGFSVEALAHRIEDSASKVVICADAGLRKGKPVELKSIVDKAVATASTKVNQVIVFDRGLVPWTAVAGQDVRWDEEMRRVGKVDLPAVPLPSDHPSYILYTSGTTGKPKGVVRDTGGYMVALHTSMDLIYGCGPDDVYWSTSDIGWVVGHSYIIYGPLLAGIPTVVYEGTPDSPNPGIWWEVIEKHGVTVLFSAPTAMRMLRRFPSSWIDGHDLSALRYVFLAGEPLDEPTYQWALETLNKPIIDHYWQTESGWPMLTNHMGMEPLPATPGSPGREAIGWKLDVVDEDGTPCPPNHRGYLVGYPPLPPGALKTLWGDDDRFVSSYWDFFQRQGKRFYFSGDYAVRDEEGNYRLLGRADEVINVAGHRMGTREVEEVVSGHPGVAEASAIGIEDEIKGEAIAVFAVLKKDVEDTEALHKEIIGLVRTSIGPIATPKVLRIVDRLPKTRSGKVMRRVLKALCEGKTMGDLSTIEDGASVEEIRSALDALGGSSTGDR